MDGTASEAPILTYEGITITEQDLECLQPREYLNDKIINFTLKYMHQILLTDAQREKVQIYDTYFMTALEQMDPNRIFRWLRKRPLFDKDYVIIPVMMDAHWFLMILDHPNNLFVDTEQAPRPKLYTLDSMGVDYAKEHKEKMYDCFFAFVQSACTVEKNCSVIRLREKIQIVPRAVEKQTNLFDCGICLLTNAEQFIIDEFHLTPSTDDDKLVLILSRTVKKRTAIRQLIKRLSQAQQLQRAQ